MRKACIAAVAVAIATFCAPPAQAQSEPTFFFSMRAFDVDPAQRFVAAYQQFTDTANAPIDACDGNTYYLTANDWSVVTAAMTNGNVVHLQISESGGTSDTSVAACLMQQQGN